MDETIEIPIFQHPLDDVEDVVIEHRRYFYELMFKYYGDGFYNNETAPCKMTVNISKLRDIDRYTIDLCIWKNDEYFGKVMTRIFSCTKNTDYYRFFKSPKTYCCVPVKFNKREEDETRYYTLTVQKQKKKRLTLSTCIKEKRNCECEICYRSNVKFYTQPIFDCNHANFCCSCIQSMKRNKLNRCPVCRQPALLSHLI